MNRTSLLSRVPSQETAATWDYDESTGEATIETFTAVGPMMECNTARRNAWSDCSRMGDLVHVGSIPMAKYFALQKAGIISEEDPKQLRFWKWCREHYQEYQSWMCVPKSVI